MKTAIYIEDGVVQLVLTPEDEFEKNIIGSLENKSTVTEVVSGGFYDCRGGWTRMRETESINVLVGAGSSLNVRERSLIIRTKKVEPTRNHD